MAHAEKCPICDGKGGIYDKFVTATIDTAPKTCHGCNGKGWVEISDSCNNDYIDWSKTVYSPDYTINQDSKV